MINMYFSIEWLARCVVSSQHVQSRNQPDKNKLVGLCMTSKECSGTVKELMIKRIKSIYLETMFRRRNKI